MDKHEVTPAVQSLAVDRDMPVIKQLVAELMEEVSVLRQEKANLCCKLERSHKKIKNVGKRLRRKTQLVEEHKGIQQKEEQMGESLADLKTVVGEMNERVAQLESQNSVLRQKRDQLDRLMYYRGRSRQLAENLKAVNACNSQYGHDSKEQGRFLLYGKL